MTRYIYAFININFNLQPTMSHLTRNKRVTSTMKQVYLSTIFKQKLQ